MTREEAAVLLRSVEAIRAYARGEAVQVKYEGGNWEEYDGDYANFFNKDWEWRVKPEPREWWIALGHGLYDSLESARKHVPDSIVIHVREVL